jgi:hypothetical protein
MHAAVAVSLLLLLTAAATALQHICLYYNDLSSVCMHSSVYMHAHTSLLQQPIPQYL